MKHLSVRNWAVRGVLIALAVLSLVVAIPLVNAHFTSHANVTGSRWTIHGHLVPAVKNLKATGKPDSSQALTLSIALSLRNQGTLNKLIAAQNDPTSPQYHHYLTPTQFAAQFSPTQVTVNKVIAWLRSQHLVIHSVSSNRTLITASGSIATVQAAFQTSLATYKVKGRTVYAPTTEPSVPQSLANTLVSISGLDDVGIFTHAPILRPSAASPHTGSGPGGGYTPNELRTAYDMSPLISSADGTGQTVAIFELDNYNPADVNAYLSNYNLGSPKYSNVLVDGGTSTAQDGAIEVELDMEDVSAIAPGANQKIYIGPYYGNAYLSNVLDVYNKITTDDLASVVSTSWGLCESAAGSSVLQAFDDIFAQMTAQGQAIFAASGDAGAYDCGTTALAVDSPADDPYVVGVGGTTLTTGSGGSYTSEAVWSNPLDTRRGPKGTGGGGGLSTYFPMPSYQSGPGVNNSYSNGKREVPDVAADADPATGYSVYCTVTAAGCSSTSPWIQVGGTSAGAPLWAGLAADLNQYLAANSKPGLGSASAELYTLFNTTQTYTPYHDITTGNNLYYPATAGYDPATGIGTPNAWNIARDLQAALTVSDFAITANPTTLPILQGSSAVSTIHTAVTTGSAGTVNLTVSVSPTGPTASLSQTTGATGYSSTLTVSVGASVVPRNYTVTVTGTEGAVVHSVGVPVTVVPSDFSISASPNTLTIPQNNYDVSTISTGLTTGDPGTVNLTTNVSPAGPTVSLSASSVAAGNSVTLTVNVGPSVATGSYTVTVTGTKDSLVRTAMVTVTVTTPTTNDFSISASPSTVAIDQGNFGSVTLSTTVTNGSPGTVSLAASVSPSTSNISMYLTTMTAGSTITPSVLVGPSADPGMYTVTVTGTEGTAVHHTTFTVTVIPNDFTLSASPTTLTIVQGGFGVSTISTTLVSGQSLQPIGLIASRSSFDFTASLGTTSLNPGNSTTVRVDIPSTVAAGTYAVMVQGGNNYSIHNVIISVIVVPSSTVGALVNGGFESGNLTGWTHIGAYIGVMPFSAHSGSYSVQVGEYANDSTQYAVRQTAKAPASATTLSFWYKQVCDLGVNYDVTSATLVDNTTGVSTTVLTRGCRSISTQWTSVSVTITPGHVYTLTLANTARSSNPSNEAAYAFFDDVAFR